MLPEKLLLVIFSHNIKKRMFIVSLTLRSLTGHKSDSSPRSHRMMPPFLLAKTDNTTLNRVSGTGEFHHDCAS